MPGFGQSMPTRSANQGRAWRAVSWTCLPASFSLVLVAMPLDDKEHARAELEDLEYDEDQGHPAIGPLALGDFVPQARNRACRIHVPRPLRTSRWVPSGGHRPSHAMPFPTLTTDRLILRQTGRADADSLLCLFSDPAVVEFYDIDAFHNRAQAEELIDLHQTLLESKRGIRWGITLRESGTLVGTAGFFGKSEAHSSALLGYDLSPSQWGQGIMVEALRAILGYGFNQYRLNRIQATTDLDSSRSIATLKRLGFQEEGILRESGFWKGKFHDVRCFSLLRSEWTTHRP